MNRKGRLLCAAVMAAQLAFHAGALARPVERAAETYESGRLGAALLALELGAVLWLQIVVFLAVSIAALIATRPLAHKMLDKTIVPTNADRVLHHTAKVTETIDNENTTGAVYIDGKTWTARSEDGDVIARGSMVTIVRMEGVKLFVRKEREEP